MHPIKIVLAYWTEWHRKRSLDWYCSIKATDMVATYKILYGLAVIPICLTITNIFFFFVIWLKFGYTLLWAVKLTVVFSIGFPTYLYFAIPYLDRLKDHSRRLYLRLKYFVFYHQTGKKRLSEFAKQKLLLRRKIVNLIEFYQTTVLKELAEERIVKKEEAEGAQIEEQISDAIKTIAGLKLRI